MEMMILRWRRFYEAGPFDSACRKIVAAIDPEKEGKFKGLAEDGAFGVAANQFIWEIAA